MIDFSCPHTFDGAVAQVLLRIVSPLLGRPVFWPGFPGLLLAVLCFMHPDFSSHHQTFFFQEHCTIIYACKLNFLWAESDILIVVFWLYDLDDKILAFLPELIHSFTVILSFFFLFFSVSLCPCYLSAAVCFICFFLPVGRHLYRLLHMTCFFQYPLIKSSCHDCNIFHITVHYWKVLVRLHNWSNTHTCKAKTFLDTSVLGVYIKILVVRRYWYPVDEWMVICDLP